MATANKKLELKNFELKKVKKDGKGLHVEWFDKTMPNDVYSVDSDTAPHEDYDSVLAKFKEILAKSLGLHVGFDLARENTRKNDEKLAEAVRLWNEETDRCNVTGVSLVGQGENEGIKITGSLKCELGTVGLASPPIKFSEEEIGIGETTRTLVEDLTKEVWSYVYANKRAKDLFSGHEEESHEPAA